MKAFRIINPTVLEQVMQEKTYQDVVADGTWFERWHDWQPLVQVGCTH
jgi:hypothetical protein